MKIKIANLMRDAERGRKIQASIRNHGEDGSVLYIYDVIDKYYGISAQQVADLLATLDGTQKLTVRINSPGGDVFEGRAIASLISQYKGDAVGIVDGLAASAATTILYACGQVRMSAGSYLMIHNAWTWGAGDKNEFADLGKLLGKMDDTIAGDYARRSSKSLDVVQAWMDAETWFDADEALQNGMADAVIDPNSEDDDGDEQPQNAFNLDVFNNVPAGLKNRVDVKNLLNKANLSFENSQRRLRLLECS